MDSSLEPVVAPSLDGEKLRELASVQGLHVMAARNVEDLDQTSLRSAEEHYKSWLDQGYHAGMQWLQKHAPLKYHPERVLPGCKSLAMFALPYADPALQLKQTQNPTHSRISLYAQRRDYHKELRKRLSALEVDLKLLYPQLSSRVLVDANPLDERELARQFGLGFTGRHGLMILPRMGSWCFLAVLLLNLRVRTLESDDGAEPRVQNLSRVREKCPSACRRCIELCPTKALVQEGVLDSRRCISYLTIEHEGEIEPELEELMGGWVFGCDVCQLVCPFTAAAVSVDEQGRAFTPLPSRPELARIPLSSWLKLRSHEDLVAIAAGSPIMRAGWKRMLRNALIAAGNTLSAGAKSTPEAVEVTRLMLEASSHEDVIIATTARRALGRLDSRPGEAG